MKKIIILAYDFPPYVSVGALRPEAWFKYFKQYDLYPIVITRQWENKFGDERDYISKSQSLDTIIEKTDRGTIIRTPYFPNFANRLYLKFGERKYRILRKVISAYFEFFQFLLPMGPKYGILKAAKKYIKENKVDYILATGDPFILFKYAYKLGVSNHVPFGLDYRDLWSQDVGMRDKIVLRKYNELFEKKYLKKAKHVITVSDFLASQIKELIDREIIISPNGFDPENYHDQKTKSTKNELFSIAYAGTIYPWHPIENFLKVLNEFCNLKKSVNLELSFFGVNQSSQLASKINNYPILKEKTQIYPKTNSKSLAMKLSQQDLLLLFNDYVFMGTKIYEYLGADRKILFCFSKDQEAEKLRQLHFPVQQMSWFNDNLQNELINKTNSGIIVRDQQDLLEKITELYDEWQQNFNLFHKSVDTDLFSRQHQVAKLSQQILAK